METGSNSVMVMRVVIDGEGLNYKLRFLHKGAWRKEVVTSPHNIEKAITQTWNELDNNEILYEKVPNGRAKAIRFPGRKY
jgi:hypothetical protein